MFPIFYNNSTPSAQSPDTYIDKLLVMEKYFDIRIEGIFVVPKPPDTRIEGFLLPYVSHDT